MINAFKDELQQLQANMSPDTEAILNRYQDAFDDGVRDYLTNRKGRPLQQCINDRFF